MRCSDFSKSPNNIVAISHRNMYLHVILYHVHVFVLAIMLRNSLIKIIVTCIHVNVLQ